MEAQIIYVLIWIIMVIAFIVINKTLGTSYTETKDIFMKTSLIMQYAEAFVSWARQFKSDLSGKEKMNVVIEKLFNIANKYNLDISETEICAIAQQAYDSMKNKEESIKAVSNQTPYLSELVETVNEIKSSPLPEITEDNINDIKYAE